MLVAALSPVVFIACGDDTVTREEAAPCVSAVRAWADAEWDATEPGVGASVRRIADAAAAEVRSACDERTLPVAAASGIELLDSLQEVEVGATAAEFCEGDPYRESRLCANVPQPGS